MNISLFEIDQQINTALMRYSTIVQDMAHQAQPDPSLERNCETALATLIRLQMIQSILLFEQHTTEYNLLVEENHKCANILRKVLDHLDLYQAHQQASRLRHSQQRAQESFETAVACLDDFARTVYRQKYSIAIADGLGGIYADRIANITVCRAMEGLTKSLTKIIGANDILEQWVAGGDVADEAVRQSIAFQLNQE